MKMETISDIVSEMRGGKLSATVQCENCGSEFEQRFKFDALADRIEEAYEREVAPLRETVEMLARVILPKQEEYPAEYGGGKVPDKNKWLVWVRAMQSNAKSALGEKGGSDGE